MCPYFKTVGTWKVVRLTALRTDRLPPFPQGNSPVTHFCYRLSRPQGLFQWKIPMTTSGIELATFRFVAQRLNNLRHLIINLEFSRQIFEKYSNIKFHRNSSIGSRVASCGRTYRLTDKTEIIVVFRSFAKALKNRKLCNTVHFLNNVMKWQMLGNSSNTIWRLGQLQCSLYVTHKQKQAG